ncbi:MAG: hypothetical protein J7M13_04120 [Synergistetes bacterium]|nr:hypothetical protein [Synergistota bacterium]
MNLKGFQIINLGSDKPVKLNRVIALIERNLGKRAKKVFSYPHPADVPRTWAKIDLAKELLGWEPKIDIEEGIKRTAKWFKENLNLVLEIELPDS